MFSTQYISYHATVPSSSKTLVLGFQSKVFSKTLKTQTIIENQVCEYTTIQSLIQIHIETDIYLSCAPQLKRARAISKLVFSFFCCFPVSFHSLSRECCSFRTSLSTVSVMFTSRRFVLVSLRLFFSFFFAIELLRASVSFHRLCNVDFAEVRLGVFATLFLVFFRDRTAPRER